MPAKAKPKKKKPAKPKAKKGTKQYIVKGKTCELLVEIPTSVSPEIRKIILDATRQCLTTEMQEKALEELEFLINSLHILLAEMKEEGVLTRDLDKAIHAYVANNVKKGMEIGKNFRGSPEVLLDMLDQGRVDFRQYIRGPKSKQRINEFVINSMQIGEQSFETGLMLAAFFSIDQQMKMLERMEEETAVYIR